MSIFSPAGRPGPAAAPGHNPTGPALPRPLQPSGVPQGGARVPVPPGPRPPAARPPPASPHQVHKLTLSYMRVSTLGHFLLTSCCHLTGDKYFRPYIFLVDFFQ